MNKVYEQVMRDKREALGQLSEQAIYAALDDGEPVVEEAVRERILLLSARAGEVLREGGDYLSILTPTTEHSSLDRVAMDIVREIFDEELEED